MATHLIYPKRRVNLHLKRRQIKDGDIPKRCMRVAVLDVSPFWMCRRFGCVAVLDCRHFGLSPFWICRRFGCRRFGCRRFGFVAILTCIRSIPRNNSKILATRFNII